MGNGHSSFNSVAGHHYSEGRFAGIGSFNIENIRIFLFGPISCEENERMQLDTSPTC